MFANKEKNTTGHRKSESGENNIKAFLGAGSEFEGRMVFNENMRIDGTFCGEISSEELLVVGETAKLQAEVNVGSLILSGHLKGNIKAKVLVELRAPAQFDGDIVTPAISIEDGVIFNGSIKMNRRVEAEVIKKDCTNEGLPLK